MTSHNGLLNHFFADRPTLATMDENWAEKQKIKLKWSKEQIYPTNLLTLNSDNYNPIKHYNVA